MENAPTADVMTMHLVHDISARDLSDVPRRLRALADEIEQDNVPAENCVCVVEWADGSIDIPAFGRRCDQMYALGLLTLGNAYLTDSIIDLGRQHGRDPGTVA